MPITESDRLVLATSVGGDVRQPASYLNLRTSPEVRATIAGLTRAMTVRTATEEERADFWPRITAVFVGYTRYQRRTERQIPVVILGPG